MKALCKLKAEPGIWMTDIPTPTIGVNDVLVKIKKTAICGTDIHIYHWDDWAKATIPVPMAVGHEFMGEIVALGDEVAGLKIGDRVSGEGHITCGHCRRCRAGEQHLCRNTIGIGVNRQGCFAEYLSIPASNIFKLPEEISDEVGSILDPLGNATHTALSFDMVGEDVLITGAGPIGIMAVAIVKKIGCRNVVISDVNDYRLNLAKKMGADRVVNVMHESIVDVMPELNIKEGYDVALEMSGNPRALNDLLRSINHGGHIAMLGIQPQDTAINWDQVIFKGLTIKGIYGREMYETWYKMSSLIQAGLDVTPVITHRFPIDEFQKGFDVMAGGEAGKVILNWDSN